MRFERARFWILAILFVWIVGTPVGCGNSSAPVEKSPGLQGDDTSFYGDVIQVILDGLIEGSADAAGEDVMGLILEKLGFGSGSNDQAALDSMSQKLDQIVALLGDIENTLKSLITQLNITQENILLNVNDPKDAITSIETSHQELQGLVQGKSPGSVDQATLLGFVERVESVFIIDKQINAVQNAILPATSASTPVLYNLADLAINRVSQQGKDLSDAYLSIENYFSQLLYYQLEGVNLFVETKIYRKKAGLPQIDGMDASAYLDFFDQKSLQPEVDNFTNSVYRLILGLAADPMDSANFLPSDSADILSRANFLRIQSLNEDHFGLRGTCIATRTIASSVVPLHAKNRATGQIYSGKGALTTAPGRTYDFWSGNAVQGSSDYSVISYDFGDVPLGNYDILDESNNVVSSASVQTFKDNYTVDSSGSIHYGHFFISQRLDPKSSFNSKAEWNWWTTGGNVNFSGSATDKTVGVNGLTDSSYSGDAELDAQFVYNGSAGSGFTVHYAAHAYGENMAFSAYPFKPTKSTVSYAIGIWDRTTNVGVYQFNSRTSAFSTDNESMKFDDKPQGSWFFPNPSPGHTYYIYFRTHIDGEVPTLDKVPVGFAKGETTIDGIAGNLYITF